MGFFSYGIPVGTYWGIRVRLHFTFLIFAWYWAQRYQSVAIGLTLVGGLYLCILLHEFGHALAARWCDGDATDIVLWPLGGLAFVRPAFNPTAHLITTAAGPFVTLVLWLALGMAAFALRQVEAVPVIVPVILRELSKYNLFLLVFNLIPAFPMDGGRMLRDTLWHWMSAEKATGIAIVVSRVIAVFGAAYAIAIGNFFLLLFPLFIFMQTQQEQQIVALESHGTHSFSIRERLRRGRKQRAFRQAVAVHRHERATTAFHRCATCGLTEVEEPTMDFRVCPECAHGQEYCRAHLDAHPHV